MKKAILTCALITIINTYAGTNQSKPAIQEQTLERILKTNDPFIAAQLLEEHEQSSTVTTLSVLHRAIQEGNATATTQALEYIRSKYGSQGLFVVLHAKLPTLLLALKHKPSLENHWQHDLSPDGVPQLQWCPHGALLSTSGKAGTVHIWAIKDPQSSWTITHGTRDRAEVVWNPKNTMVATVGGDVKIWNTEQKKIITTIKHKNAQACWSHDGEFLATASNSGKVNIWRAHPQGIIGRVNHATPIYALEWSPCSPLLVTASSDGIVNIWHVLDTEVRHLDTITHEEDGNRRIFVYWSPDGSKLAISFYFCDTTIHIWDASAKKQIFTIKQGNTAGVDWNPHSKVIATYGRAHVSQIWDCEKIELIDTIEGSNHIEWSPDGTMLISEIWMDSYVIWCLQTKQVILTIDTLRTWSWSPDSSLLASISKTGDMCIFDFRKSIINKGDREICTLTCPPDSAGLLEWSPDSLMVAFSNRGGNIQKNVEMHSVDIWSCMEKKIIGRVLHNAKILRLAWNKQNTYFASASQDKTVKIWSILENRLVATIKHADEVWKLSWHPEHSILVTASKDGTTELWQTPRSVLDIATENALSNGENETVALLVNEYKKLNLSLKGICRNTLLINACNVASTIKSNQALYEKLSKLISIIANTPGAPL